MSAYNGILLISHGVPEGTRIIIIIIYYYYYY